MVKHTAFWAVAVTALAMSACNNSESSPAGPEQRESRSVELDKAESVRVELKMPVGEMDVRGGAQKLMDADFTYNVPEWKPDVRYNSTGAIGDLLIEQHGSSSTSGNKKNNWNLRFNDKVPLDIRAQVGAGEGRLNIGSLNLRTVNLEMGAGTLNLDLRGAPTKDYSVYIRGGVGEVTVHLPKGIGVSAKAEGALGNISVTGLHKSGDRYVNDAYEQAGIKINLDIKGGLGSVNLIAE